MDIKTRIRMCLDPDVMKENIPTKKLAYAWLGTCFGVIIVKAGSEPMIVPLGWVVFTAMFLVQVPFKIFFDAKEERKRARKLFTKGVVCNEENEKSFRKICFHTRIEKIYHSKVLAGLLKEIEEYLLVMVGSIFLIAVVEIYNKVSLQIDMRIGMGILVAWLLLYTGIIKIRTMNKVVGYIDVKRGRIAYKIDEVIYAQSADVITGYAGKKGGIQLDLMHHTRYGEAKRKVTIKNVSLSKEDEVDLERYIKEKNKVIQ